MRPDQALDLCIGALRLDGHSADVLAVALAESAVDCLIAGGFSRHTLDAGLKILTEAMRERADDFYAAPRRPLSSSRQEIIPKRNHLKLAVSARD